MKISLKNNINSVSYVKSHFAEVLDEIKESQTPMIITQNGASSGVLLDVSAYESIQKKIELLKLINQGEESIKNNSTVSLSTVKRNFKNKYGV